MAISESARSDLYTGLRDVLGSDRAETLMSAIPLHDLDEVATKGDVAELREATRADIAELRAELKGDIAGVRSELKGDIAGLRAELKDDIAGLQAEIKGELADTRKTMTTWFLTLATANLSAVVGVALLVS